MANHNPRPDSFGTTALSSADGQWHLLALSYEDGENVKLYMDGVLLAESSSNYAAAAYDRGFTLIGGRDIGGPLGWNGTAGTFAYYGQRPDARRHPPPLCPRHLVRHPRAGHPGPPARRRRA